MDLLNTLGKKESKTPADGAASAAPQPNATAGKETNSATTNGSNKSESAATGQNSAGANDSKNSSDSGKGEPTSGQTDASTWTVESALKEVKKLREENKQTRLKYEENIETLKKDMEARVVVRDEQLTKFKTAQQELDELKEKEADKKRDMAERVAHREAQLAATKMQAEATERKYQEELLALKSRVAQFDADQEARRTVQRQRLNEELATIPEKYKEVASLIVKGAGSDPADGMLALNEAKIKGVFEDKTIVVNHSVPGAGDGARASRDRIDAADKDMRAKMTSQQKIGQALKDMKQQPNSAFRTNK